MSERGSVSIPVFTSEGSCCYSFSLTLVDIRYLKGFLLPGSHSSPLHHTHGSMLALYLLTAYVYDLYMNPFKLPINEEVQIFLKKSLSCVAQPGGWFP